MSASGQSATAPRTSPMTRSRHGAPYALTFASAARNASTFAAQSRPALIAPTTSDCPRRMSPQAKMRGLEVWFFDRKRVRDRRRWPTADCAIVPPGSPMSVPNHVLLAAAQAEFFLERPADEVAQRCAALVLHGDGL